MQKKLIALAVAGLVSAPAFAQSNVTIYGVLDTFVGYSKAGEAKATGLISGGLAGNRIGFKGTEDLGNGLKASFVLEQGFNIDDGQPSSSRQFHRQAWVGLKGGFGAVALGRQYAPGYFATSTHSAVSAGPLDPQAVLSAGLSINPGSAARWDNSLTYKTPNMSGFTASAIYSFTGTSGTEVGDDRNDSNDLGLGLDYKNGPLGISYVYHNTEDKTKNEVAEHYIGASYDFGVAKLIASYQVANFEPAAGSDYDAKVAYLGAIIPVGAGNIHAAVGKRSDDRADRDATSYALAYTYGLSKRTTLYAGINRTSNDDNAAFGSVLDATGENETAYALGVNHKF
ncbi:porin [Zoogloeaceae bacteirum Par-f-2]|nr:porin [Zoogloeaceae bacteirum Par-f-2]